MYFYKNLTQICYGGFPLGVKLYSHSLFLNLGIYIVNSNPTISPPPLFVMVVNCLTLGDSPSPSHEYYWNGESVVKMDGGMKPL